MSFAGGFTFVSFFLFFFCSILFSWPILLSRTEMQVSNFPFLFIRWLMLSRRNQLNSYCGKVANQCHATDIKNKRSQSIDQYLTFDQKNQKPTVTLVWPNQDYKRNNFVEQIKSQYAKTVNLNSTEGSTPSGLLRHLIESSVTCEEVRKVKSLLHKIGQ